MRERNPDTNISEGCSVVWDVPVGVSKCHRQTRTSLQRWLLFPSNLTVNCWHCDTLSNNKKVNFFPLTFEREMGRGVGDPPPTGSLYPRESYVCFFIFLVELAAVNWAVTTIWALIFILNFILFRPGPWWLWSTTTGSSTCRPPPSWRQSLSWSPWCVPPPGTWVRRTF